MIRRSFALLVLTLMGVGCAPVCPPPPETHYAHPVPAVPSPPAGLSEGRKLLEENRFADAVETLRTVEQEFSGTEWSGSAAYAVAVAFTMADNPQQDYGTALIEFDRFIERYPRDDRAAEARSWRQAIKQILDLRKENARLRKNIEQLTELDLQQEEKRRGK